MHNMRSTGRSSDKRHRWNEIRRAVNSGRVATQADIDRWLRRHGHRVDQSTLSRDLAELGIRKRAGRYVLAPVTTRRAPGPQALASAVSSFTTCGPHLIVVRTSVGQAQPVSLAIDHLAEPSIVATLAGDDTIFVATHNRRTQSVALRRLEQWFGEKYERH